MDNTEYSHVTEIAVRYRDIDLMGWSHNSVFLVYVEEAKIKYFQEVLGVEVEDVDGAIVHQEINYKKPVSYEDTVVVKQRVTKIGESSLTIQFRLETNNDLAAEGKVVHTFLDERKEPEQIPEEWADNIRKFEPALATE